MISAQQSSWHTRIYFNIYLWNEQILWLYKKEKFSYNEGQILEPQHHLVEAYQGFRSMVFCAQGFIFSSLCGPHHCVTHSTEVQGRVTPYNRWFLQVERGLALVKFSLKTVVALNQLVPSDVFQKELETLIVMLDIPKKRRAPRHWIGALHSHWIPFRDRDLIFWLSHRLSAQSTWKLTHSTLVQLLTKNVSGKNKWKTRRECHSLSVNRIPSVQMCAEAMAPAGLDGGSSATHLCWR